jgi:DNA-binding MarR family transcriptional regulator
MNNLTKLNQLITEFYDKMSSWEQSVVRETGYSLAQIHTIEVLGNYGNLRMKELAEKLGITTGTLTVQIEKLVKAELIERQPHHQDKRSVVVGLTAEGLKIHNHHNQLHMALVAELTRGLSTEQEGVLLVALEVINQQF